MNINNAGRVAFVLFTNLGLGAGTEITILEYIDHIESINDKIKFSLVQTDYMANSPVERRVYESPRIGVSLETLKSPFSTFLYERIHNVKILDLLYTEIFYPVLYLIMNIGRMRRVYNDADVLYFVRSEDVIPWTILFKSKVVKTIVAGHCGLTERRALRFSHYKANLIRKFSSKVQFLTPLQASSFGMVPGNDFILNSGVNTSQFYPTRGSEDGMVRFIFVGRLEESKGILELMDAVEYFKDETWFHCTIVGSGRYGQDISKIACERIEYLGYVSETQLQELYRKSDVFLFPTHGESFGLVAVEAVSSGLFCLASSKIKGNFDDLERIGCLKYVDCSPTNLRHEIAALKGYKLDLTTRKKWHELIKDRYDWHTIAKTLNSEMTELIRSISNVE